ncbi:MAG: DNA polymerase III subunit alpha [Caldilineaceae bacterium]|nr:DNA polymerase III subunit alpha [Caldilineaceae bacterium]
MFTHLHVHSHYSLLGATASIEDLVARAKADGLSHLALTDTNALVGAVAFQRACGAAGIQPITGMVLTVQPPVDLPGLDGLGAGRLVLLADGPDGYRSLCRLSSAVQARPDRVEAVQRGVAWADLRANRDGLICLVGGRMDWLQTLLAGEDQAAALGYVARLAGVFDAKLFLTQERPGGEGGSFGPQIYDLARRFGVGTVAVQPIYTLFPNEKSKLKLLAAMDRNCRVQEVPASALPDGGDAALDLHWLSPGQMAERFADVPEALAQAGEIAEMCRPALPDGRPIWPVLDLPAGQSADEALRAAAEAGLVGRYGADPDPAIPARLDAELAAIGRHGYAPLFLLVADVVRYAHSRDIPVSTRGSVANSLAAYALGITTVDPILHDLLFQRFLNPARREPPDIDLDFCSRRRDEVLGYIRDKHGADRVALVATISTMQAKSAVGETAKAYGLDKEAIAGLLKRLPRGWHPDPRRRERKSVDEILAEISDPLHRRAMREGYELVGQPHHISVHPGGVVVTPGPLTDIVPLQWTPKGFNTTQFDHGDVEAIGLVKMDLLGIRALTVLADAAEMVRARHDPTFRTARIPTDDGITGEMLRLGETVGVFQCESSGAQRTLRQLKARSVQDLAVANAFFKPGPATGGMAAAFVRRYRGEERVSFLHPSLAPILGKTQGVLLFQEQILRVAVEIAGLAWSDAEHLRRGMSKFQAAEMAALRDKFIAGCMRPGGPGFSAKQAETLWTQVEAFAGYGFNQGHATAYADVSYRSAYMKAHFPAEFLCARLADWGGFHHQAVYIAEARRLGIGVRPPHINYSGSRFVLGTAPPPSLPQIGGGADLPSMDRHSPFAILYMGLGQIRDLRHTSVRAIVAGRPFGDLRDLLHRVDLRAKEIEHLICCGALDGLGSSRAALLFEADEIRRAGTVAQLGFDFGQAGGSPSVPAETPSQRVTWERQILGQPISVHPVQTVTLPPDCVPLAEAHLQPGRRITMAGARLPGWTGGKGFFLDDGQNYITVIEPEGSKAPAVGKPVTISGRWRVDAWGGGVLQGERVEGVSG